MTHVVVLDPFTGRCDVCGLMARSPRADHVTYRLQPATLPITVHTVRRQLLLMAGGNLGVKLSRETRMRWLAALIVLDAERVVRRALAR